MNGRSQLVENDADDSDSDSSNGPDLWRQSAPRQRSATVSPASRHGFKQRTNRRRSDAHLSVNKFHADRRIGHPMDRRPSADKTHGSRLDTDQGALRKTSSEPSVEHVQQMTIDAIRKLADSYQRLQEGNNRRKCIATAATDMGLVEVWATPRQSLVPEPDSDEELINTDIEELREAAESIQSLKRVLKIEAQQSGTVATQGSEDSGIATKTSFEDDRSSIFSSESETTNTLKGITTNLGGFPRGVIQFLPSIKNDSSQFQPILDTYTWSKHRERHTLGEYAHLLRRKTSVPEGYMKYASNKQTSAGSERSSPRARPAMRIIRPYETDIDSDIFGSSDTLKTKGADSIAGISRFSKLLNSLRTTQTESQLQTGLLFPPQSPTSSSTLQKSLLQADQLLWKKRSRASLRRHAEIRTMALRELFETEKSFVEGLECLVQKYMRPLKQPLECTLIDSSLVEKIFYKIPEILAHHQFLLAALNSRVDGIQNDSIIGDVLLSHFNKQSMVDTYIAFVDNFKFAKQAIWEARQRPAFEKYYMRCCREHKNKLDLDSLLILPIQRVPRYELVIKQIIKHTPVEHRDYEKLLHAQQNIHELAVTINRQREEKEQMEQRLREIEAIVDGLDDLVSSGRTFHRYDLVNVQDSMSVQRQRCIFMMSDQLIVTSVRRKPTPNGKSARNQALVQSPDFLDNNRFKLLIKISLDDVEITKDTFTLVQDIGQQLTNAQEDVNIISKMNDLAKLLKQENGTLTKLLEDLHYDRLEKLRAFQDQMNSNPDLTSVQLQVTTFDGVETLTIQFPNATKRSIWETAFSETKNSLKNVLQHEQNLPQLKTIITHKTRSGLVFTSATPTFGKTIEGAPNVWVCAADKFSGQVAVVSVANEPTIDSCTGMGNAAITAVCAVPAPKRRKKQAEFRSENKPGQEKINMDLDSSSSDSESSETESISSSQSTIWIGNEDGEIYIFNCLDNIRLKAREKMVRLSLPIVDIVYVEENVFVSMSSKTHNQLLCFHRARDLSWDLERSKVIRMDLKAKINTMIAVTNRLCFGAENVIYLMNPINAQIEKCATFGKPSDHVSVMAAQGSMIFMSMQKSANVKMVNAFTLECLMEFSITSTVNKALSSRDDLIRQHKMGCLRISALLCCRNQLWIGTSAGIILNTSICSSKTVWSPTFHVCPIGHAGPCRFLTSVNISSVCSLPSLKKRRMSLNAPSLQQFDQVYVISGGSGIDHMIPQPTIEGTEDEVGVDDAVNHLIFWQI